MGKGRENEGGGREFGNRTEPLRAWGRWPLGAFSFFIRHTIDTRHMMFSAALRHRHAITCMPFLTLELAASHCRFSEARWVLLCYARRRAAHICYYIVRRGGRQVEQAMAGTGQVMAMPSSFSKKRTPQSAVPTPAQTQNKNKNVMEWKGRDQMS